MSTCAAKRFAIWLLVPACAVIFSTGSAADIQRTIDFRDGTVLQVTLPDSELPWRTISADGQVAEQPVKLSDVEQLRFVLTPATEQVAEVRQLVVRLGAEDFHAREEAQQQLIERGAKFRTIIEQMYAQALAQDDFEVKWRLKEVINALPVGVGLLGNDYDQLERRGDTKEFHGDVGRWSLRANYRGAEVVIDRQSVLAIRNAPLSLDLSAEPTVVHMERIERDSDSLFPKEVVRIDFERGPRGESIAVDSDISEAYVLLGCTFATSFKDSFVCITPYTVGGRSGGRSAATQNPLYQGVMTIRFCKPGNARLPAGVHYVGFWTSHIAKDGTALQAYDARDRMIAEVKTVKNQRDFLAVTTNIPIAYIKVVPDTAIDPDYAIDDLVFDPPRLLSEAGDPDRFSVVLTNGERLQCALLDTDDDVVLLKKLTIGVEELRIPREEIAVLVPPRTPVPDVLADQRCFVRLEDGSVMRCETDQGLRLGLFPQQEIPVSQLIALWGADITLTEPASDVWPESGGVVVSPNGTALQFADWKVGKNWIEAPELGKLADSTYANSPSVWLRRPTKRPAGSGLLRTSAGEEIVLGGGDGFTLQSWSRDGVTIRWGEQERMLPLIQVSSLLLPQGK